MNSWYKKLNKAPFSPPDWIFGIVWPILYILMFLALLFVWTNKKCYPYCKAVTYFIIQLFFNLIWTTIFFKYKQPKLALLDIGFILFFTIVTFKQFKQISTQAAYLLIPYIIWLCFAAMLNTYIVLNN